MVFAQFKLPSHLEFLGNRANARLPLECSPQQFAFMRLNILWEKQAATVAESKDYGYL